MKEKNDNLINLKKFNVKYQQVSFDIPTNIGQLLEYYVCKAHLFDSNKFVEDTLDGFIRDNCKNIKYLKKHFDTVYITASSLPRSPRA